MQIVYFSHSYRPEDQRVNDFFSRLMESEGLVLSLDPPSESVNTAKLQRHLNSNDGMVAVVTWREGGVSPFIRFEINLCLRSRKPLLVFVEDVLPDGLIPARVLQRRFSRGAFLRQVREHRHAVRVFQTYMGEDPPPRYQPEISQRSCVFAGEEVLTKPIETALETMLSERGYRTVRSSALVDDQAGIAEALSQADVALAFLDARSPTAHYARGLLAGASVPTVEFIAEARSPLPADVPEEFTPCRFGGPEALPLEVCQLAVEQLRLAEQDFLELPNQEKVDAYFTQLVDIGTGRGRYSDEDQERVVKVVMGDQYNVTGQAGIVGPGGHANSITFVQSWNEVSATGDTEALAADLERLRNELRAKATDPEHDVAVAALAEAELKAKDGDGPGAMEQLSRLGRLKGAGKWALGAATAIGTTVAAAALKIVLGI